MFLFILLSRIDLHISRCALCPRTADSLGSETITSLFTVLGGIDLHVSRYALCPRTDYSLGSETYISIIRFIPHFPGFIRDRKTPRSRKIAGGTEQSILRLRNFHSIVSTVHSDVNVATAAR